ncbi:MAG: hypothetical protein J6D26_00585 [Clostridia bacterium]|nr:hypothetical protein [Clostridia bacterium]
MTKKKSLRLVSFVLIFMMLLSALPVMASAETSYDYLIEGEAFKACNFATSAGSTIQGKSACSQKQYINLYSKPSNDVEYYVQWEVTADKDGIYAMDIASTPLAPGGWSSPIYVQVNGGEEVMLTGEQFATLKDDNQIAWYHTNSLYLTEGANTIRFNVRDRVANNNTYVCFIDCFTLTRGEFGLKSVTAKDAPFGVYQENQELSMFVEANCNAKEDTEYVYEVIDYLGNTVRAGKGTIKAGADASNIKLASLPKGHYTVIASTGASSVCGYFSIVTALENRKKYEDTPFGLDASPYGIYMNTGRQFLESYIDLLELSGVTWIRDRCYFTSGITPSGDSYKIELPVAGKSGEMLQEKGIKVSTTFNHMARNIGNLTLDYSTVMPTDILEVYKFWKALAKQYDGDVTVWEPLNEFDLGGGGSNSDSPDLYSSVFKAMAIGASDADTENPVYLTSEPASSSSGPYYSNKFIEMMFENDLFDYASVDNYHSHRSAQEPYDVYYSTDDGHTMRTLADGYKQIFKDYDTYPLLWNTESGIYLPVEKADDLNSLEQTVQAKYLVTSSIEAIAHGSDKYFYFYGPAYQEGSRQWGMTSRSETFPAAYTSWPALSALTHVTGQGDYLGYIDAGDDIAVYAFADGEDTVFVFYAKAKDKVGTEFEFNTGTQTARYFDFFANESNLTSANGKYKVKVSDFPTYIKFTGKAPVGLIQNPENIVIDKLGAPNEYSKAQRIILTQRYDDPTRQGVRTGGYKYNQKVNKVTLEVTNLNDTAADGTITAVSTAGWKVTPASQPISVEPMSTAKLEFEIIPDGFKSLDSKIVFQGEFYGELTSKSVAYGKSKEVVSAQPIIVDGNKYLKVFLENTSDTEKVVNKIELKTNDYVDTTDKEIVLAAQQTTEILLPAQFEDDTTLDINMKAYFTDSSVCTFTTSIDFAVIEKSINITKTPDIVLPQDGEIKSAMHYGEDDLSAKIWLAADEENFYMTAHVTDNKFSQDYSDENAWNGDGFQFAIGNGLPATATRYAEIGIADTPKGPQVHCWTNQLGGGTGILTKSRLEVEHDKNLTKYAVTIPWSEIPDFNYENMLMSFSLLLNENDGGGRLGYIEWGSGIGSKKQPEKFRTILFK